MPNFLNNKFISVNTPVISKEARQYAAECLKTGWISSAGPFVPKFESAFAQYCEMPYGIAVSNGTAALHLALKALGIGEGDEVIVPAFTMIASVFAVLYTGANPVFVDCELKTFNMDVSLIEAQITPRTRAIMPVHIFGHPCEMDTILEIAKKHGLKVIEDAAEAHGALYKNRKCGSMSDVSCFSFYANKIVTTGEGGMLLTRDPETAERARKLRDLCHSDERRFIHEDLGFNYRLTNIQAAIGCGELENIDRYIARKIAVAERYTARLREIPGIQTPVTLPHAKNVFWMYGIVVHSGEFGRDKPSLRAYLKDAGIDTRDFFYPPEDQPALRKLLKNVGNHPRAKQLAENGCYLPSGLALTDEEIDYVCESIKKLQG